MEINRVNLVEKDCKIGVLSKQIKRESYDDFVNKLSKLDKKNFEEMLKEKDEIIDGLYKEINRLTVENNRLIVLHNESINTDSEADNSTKSFLNGNYEGYDIDAYAKAFEEENKVIM